MEFEAPEKLEADKLYLDGSWNITGKYARGSEGDSILINYGAKNVNMVLDGNGTEVKVYHNEEQVGEKAGTSLEGSTLKVSEEKLYSVISKGEYSRGRLRLEIEEGELEAYTFTFG